MCKVLLASPGWSHGNIIKTFAISSKTVTAIANNTYSPKKAGTKPKFTEAHIDYVLDLAFLNPRLSSESLARKFQTIKKNGFKYLATRKIQELNEVQISVRYNFSFQLLKTFNEADEFWKMLVFTDESRFCASSDAGRYCWRRVDDFRKDVCDSYAKYPVSCMVWGAIGYNFKPDLVFITGKLDSNAYIALLRDNHIFEACNTCFNDNFIFQQDGAPPHSSQMTLDWIQIEKEVKLLLGWPPNSPDLSPIEILWGAIKLKISRYEEFPRTYDELCAAVKREWANFEMESINSLVLSFRNRLIMCKNVGGQSISQFISARLQEIPSDNIIPEDQRPPLFTEENDEKMFSEFQKIGRKWKKISSDMGGSYTPVLVKYRVLLLNAMKSISERLNFQLENPNYQEDDEEEDGTLSEIISFETFMKQYCSYKKIREIAEEITETPISSIRRNRITIRFEENSSLTEIPRNDAIIYASDDLTITTDESED